ncbi:MAG: hypothetical protein DMG30_06060 [Acidobacteria bacterium]|nr:MAG: hypothetical protein DMG30_06060 [Acidobacteriota bacterium]
MARATSKAQGVMGRKRISKEARDLIFRMVDENPTWLRPEKLLEMIPREDLCPHCRFSAPSGPVGSISCAEAT